MTTDLKRLDRHEQDVDVLALLAMLVREKIIVGLGLIVGGVIGVVVATAWHDLYTSESVLAPAEHAAESSRGVSGAYGSLAALAGIQLGTGTASAIDQAIILAESEPFLSRVIVKRGWIKDLNDVKGWDKQSAQTIYETSPSAEVIDEREIIHQAYSKLKEAITVSRDAKSGLITVRSSHPVPAFSAELLVSLVEELNDHFRRVDLETAKVRIKYLENQIQATSVAEIRDVLYDMIEAQMKTLMLADAGDEYLLTTVVPPTVPIQRSSPNRSLIVIIGLMFGGVIGVIGAIAAAKWKDGRRSNEVG